MKVPPHKFGILAALSLAMLTTPSGLFAEPERASKASSQSAFRQINHISVQVLGTKGSPVILIPGLSSPRAAWDGVAPALAKLTGYTLFKSMVLAGMIRVAI